jgi:putative MATE family efflux protein
MVLKRKTSLAEGPVGWGLLKLTLPMTLGIFSIVVFNLTDTYFVSRLGTRELAAMSFTFPVVLLVGSIALGLGTGAASVLSRAIGRGDHENVRRVATDSLVLGMGIVFLFVLTGLLTIDPVFSAMGATKEILPLIRQYMKIWYIGMIFVVIPMVGNNAIRATGDTVYPSLIMTTSAVVNVVLDPVLIFGLWGFPRMGIAGAALATVIARSVSMTLSLLILYFREKMLDFSLPSPGAIWKSWKQILYIGLPTAGTNILIPLSLGVITRIVSQFGSKAVAAMGAGARIEAFAMIAISALSVSMIPFIGQNWGSREYERIRLSFRFSHGFSMIWGLLCFAGFLLFSGFIARLFSNDPAVIRNIKLYLVIISIGYGLQGIALVTASVFNALNKPLISAVLNIVRMFIFYIPFSLAGSILFGLKGVFIGIVLSNTVAGIISIHILGKTYGKMIKSCVEASRKSC